MIIPSLLYECNTYLCDVYSFISVGLYGHQPPARTMLTCDYCSHHPIDVTVTITINSSPTGQNDGKLLTITLIAKMINFNIFHWICSLGVINEKSSLV